MEKVAEKDGVALYANEWTRLVESWASSWGHDDVFCLIQIAPNHPPTYALVFLDDYYIYRASSMEDLEVQLNVIIMLSIDRSKGKK